MTLCIASCIVICLSVTFFLYSQSRDAVLPPSAPSTACQLYLDEFDITDRPRPLYGLYPLKPPRPRPRPRFVMFIPGTFVRFSLTVIKRPRNIESFSTKAFCTMDGSANSTYA